ncbi:ABC transporter substrate-binding protein [uncultured Tyzzerella sp.]|uniref:ABC transporter substrate-binding protein n=1 Tax=uncultured Tyzzerella sp. TaxID=2321398 RepID=UPI00294316DA|nr:ABC transporter substrate-binding protein [uncultured Tyzzerella sp.]
MKSFKKLILIFAIMLATMLSGCGDNTTKQDDKQSTSSLESTSDSNKDNGKVLDREGNEIVLPEKTDKIISLAPSITETLINLGLTDNLVAVDKYSIKVEGVNKDLPIFDIMNPDAENIVSIQPDIIFGTGMSKSKGTDPFSPMVEMGAFVTVVPTSTSIDGIKEDILYIGKVTKKEEEAKKIVSEYDEKINSILKEIESLKIDEPISVYFETSPMPEAYTFGKDTFLNDMLNLLGAKNIFDDQEGWLPVSEEQVVAKNPSVIITNADYIENVTEEIKNRAGWENIDAVKNDRVYVIEQNTSARANENSIQAFENIAKALYPELQK